MTNTEYLKLKSEILTEVTASIDEILKKQLEPLTEVLKNFIPNNFKEEKDEDKFPRDKFGNRKKTKVLLGRDQLGRVVKQRLEIQRDGFGCVRKNLLKVSGYYS